MDHQAFAQLLGNYGEFVGAIAVVFSLVFLAFQVRRNTQQLASNEKALLRAESASAHEQWSNWRQAFIYNPNIMEIWQRGNGDYDSLDPVETGLFGEVAKEMMFAVNNMWEREQEGVLAPDMWSNQLRRIQSFISTETGKRWWLGNRDIFPSGFVNAIEGKP